MQHTAATTTTARAGRRTFLGRVAAAFGGWLASARAAPRPGGHADSGCPPHGGTRLDVRGGWLLHGDDR